MRGDAMLVAECHGKVRSEVEHDEDYLTSAVFGHLRYICPPLFWHSLFMRAKASDVGETSLAATLQTAAIHFDSYTSVQVKFWPYSAGFGEPDMLLEFNGLDVPPVLIMVEVKLWAGKSGSGERDQLWRYLQLLDRISQKTSACFSALVYLTPRDSLVEIEESLSHVANPQQYANRLFRLQWQDVQAVARTSIGDARGSDQIILHDVGRFLKRRGLEYFSGFTQFEPMPDLEGDGRYYSRATSGHFTGMVCGECPDSFPILKGGWIR
jgi:hypothetical protein